MFFVGHALQGLQQLNLTLWLLNDMLYRQGFFSSVCQAIVGVTGASTTKVYQ